MYRLITLINLLLISIPASALEYPYAPRADRVQIINFHEAKLYNNYEENVQRIWGLTQSLTAHLDPDTPAPVLVFEEFNQETNRPEWTEFQESWFTETQLERPFDAKRLPAYFYTQTPFIQIRPSYVHEAIQPSPGHPGFTDAQPAYYTAGHEFLHYLLEQEGFEPELHHCLMLERLDDEQPSISEQLLSELQSQNLAAFSTQFILHMEIRAFPCRKLSEPQMDRIRDFLRNLKNKPSTL